MAFKRGFKAEANRIALCVRAAVGLGALDRLDVERVCEHFEISLLKMSELACDTSRFSAVDTGTFSAVTVHCGGKAAIVHNDAHQPHRQRSNICHELAHCFLGHKATPPLNAKGERSHDGGIEAEANFLGGALLLPNEAAIHVLKSGLRSSASELYGISSSMLEYRLRMSGAYTWYERLLRRRR